ncbi:Fucose permease [Nonlabens sp. Hel1_33_55]|uniref:MFS transporter n=1 Tax=Nonlabens sp. Hel1_33_55 TaxID=1336802 RepID=UPI000875DC44|nr:MFS transporter [Nonlabens sp. Hel1_33_55]SCY07617.1 Fucose permease [Nonlabens sp. Hel1_33_55]
MKSLQLILSHLKYFAPAWVFSSVNILIGTWILYIPHIKLKFGLDDSEIGIALFFTACGLLISIPLVPIINAKLGAGKSTKYGIIGLALLYNLPLLAPNYYMLCASLLGTGLFSGFTGTSMNATVSIIESKDQQNFLSAAHGFFSLGGFIGAGIGSFLILSFTDPSYHMLLISSIVIITTLFLSKYYTHITEDPKDENTQSVNIFKNVRPVLGLSIVAFIVLFNEGAVEHWSNLFLFDVVHVTESQAGYGFIVFSLTMTLGRFLGDGISNRIGATTVMAYGFILAALAYGLILASNIYVSVLGFGILGLGISVIIPELFRLAGRTKRLSASLAISVVSGIGFLGFLVGPVLLGFISNISSLTMSYVFLLALVVLAFLLVIFWLRTKYKLR